MKHQFIIDQHADCLTLFFLGWSMDATPFVDYTTGGSDLLVVWDYTYFRNLKPLLKRYKTIHLVAWSMGVWAATHCLQGVALASATAIHGTPQLADNSYGIPVPIFTATVRTLTPDNLARFNRRMCGAKAAYETFLTRAPQRPFASQLRELRVVDRERIHVLPEALAWTAAYAGAKDMIFPQEHVQRAFPFATITQSPHYDEALMREIIARQ